MRDLIQEYSHTLRQLKQMRETAAEQEQTVIGSMASDIQYALDWMRSGKRPGSRRGIERRAAYQRAIPRDPHLIEKIVPTAEEHTRDIGEWNRFLIEDAMSTLTDLEREVYLMSTAGGLPQREIARMMRLSRSSVRVMLLRAERKIREQVKTSLFCQSS